MITYHPEFKKNWKKALLLLSLLLILLLCLFVAIQIIPFEKKDDLTLKRLAFHGTYQFSEKDLPKTYTADAKIDASRHDTLILKGFFNRPVSEDVQVLFMIRYLEVHIYNQNTEVFSFGEEGRYPSIMQSEGSSWGHFIMPFTASEDQEWTIILKNKYDNNYGNAYTSFINSLFTGDQGDLLERIIIRNLFFVIPGFLFLVFGTSVLLALLVLKRRKITVHHSVPIGALYMLMMGLSILLDPVLATLLIDGPILVMFAETLVLIFSAPLLLFYIRSFSSPGIRKIINGMIILTILAAIWYLVSQLFGYFDAFSAREYLIPFYILMMSAILLLSFTELKRCTARLSRHVFISLSILIFFYLLEFANYELELMQKSLFMTMGYTVFMLMQAYLAIKSIGGAILSAKQIAEMEKELTESRMAIMLSQIQPHFLYNALNTIRYLCVTDPKLAGKTVESFAKYLRANMDSLKQTTPIPFLQELDHLKNYLSIETLRFEDVHIEYDLKSLDFKLPPLTIQPIVENAIKHGVTQKDEGGTVWIKTWSDERRHYIEIKDNGAGFDITAKKQDGRTHIGIANTKERLAAMCGGSMAVESRIDEGTTVSIMLPVLPEEAALDSVQNNTME